ncbi:MAG: hypothetical protein C0504_18580 [Candidatus Solibacter sp.]|nr:hypothetical protein [Candidatus Solibacter sp.]
MAALSHPLLRRAICFGSGTGLELGARDMRAVVVRVRPAGVSLIAETVIQSFRERPAADWGGELQKFLAAHEALPLATVALLPREEVLLRLVPLPGLTDEDAAAAIRLQADTLHPWGDDEGFAIDFQRLAGSPFCAVALARQETIDSYTAMFTEAGVKLAGFTLLAGAVYRASRIYTASPGLPRLALPGLAAGLTSAVEVYGESEAKPLFSAKFDTAADRAIALSAAEMRIDLPEEVVDLFHLLPVTGTAPAQADLSGQARSLRAPAYAAALAAASLHLGEPLNLLPAALRRGTSKALYVPTLALCVLLAAALIGMAVEGRILERRHMERLQAEITRLEPAAKRLDAADRQTAGMAQRIHLIDSFRKRSQADLDALKEVNRLLPPPAFVQQLVIDGATVSVAGEADQAESLLKKFDESPLFHDTEFTMPLNRGQSGESFRLRTKREAAR